MPINSQAPIGQQLLDVPFPDMIRSMGLSIAEAQYELDLVALKIAQLMAGQGDPDADPPQTDDDLLVSFGGENLTLLELGFTPTFYQFVDTIIEVKISISITFERSTKLTVNQRTISVIGGFFAGFGGAKIKSSSVGASYASKFQYSAEGASLLRTKLVPVPPPAVLEERIRRVLEEGG